MELNANEIIKALECCVKADTHYDCRELNCPALINDECIYTGITDHESNRKQFADALALIKQLTQAHEMLSESYDHLEKTKDELLAERSRLTEENERLKKDNEYILMQHAFQRRPSGDCWNDVIEKAKADTVREMQSRLAQYIGTYTDKSFVYVSAMFKLIDKIAKEMIGDE